ncbi:Similar to wcd: U3 small nucleolar RNA-associated protein 18 homolog (Drosophila melanogaster) [Cotesia congregata]|uniref:Similar to wcd: U3 small nucleolar RNA-associated protein 18 homolog (Drosophila melanogaster) n=1 Tax=Cotesia congregata TaxID=51543 RepID=A0A8J2HMH0_COTCN|nr:Similar to wcd: U3 small nucleolar RNA-associated protein 18 homolog (Drosophila melanogaster) [Cotesia congregata]
MAPRKAKRQKLQYDPEVEARLQQVVFKDSEDFLKNLSKHDKSNVKVSNKTEETSKGQDSGISEDNEDHDNDKTEESDDEEHDSDKGGENDKTKENESDEDKEDDSHDDDDDDDDDDEAEEDKPECTRVWFDDDEENYSYVLFLVKDALKIQHRKLPGGRPEKSYNELLENKFKSLVGTPKWAKIDREKAEDSDESDEELLQHSNRLKIGKDKKLPRGTIEIKALTDINTETHSEGSVVTSLQFHPTSTVALVAGLSGVLSIFKVDGQDNNKLHSLQFEHYKINAAKFLRDGNEIIAGSRKNYCQLYDLMSGKICKIPLPNGVTKMTKFEVSPDGKYIAVIGKLGQIYLLSAFSKELIHTFMMNNKCIAATFTPDSKNLITSGGN